MSKYKDTLNLPQTTFSMRANSKVLEPELQKFWDQNRVYEKNLELRQANNKSFILHDGPPYLSSSAIHIGTALNKILKDIIVKYKTLSGYYSPFVFGYDCHGLPIEHEVIKKVKAKKDSIDKLEIRKRCKEFALSNLDGQQANFKRLGVLGDWDRPYLTMNKKYEASEIRVFKEFVKKGLIYKGFKPIYWCSHCETALAEAEVEYNDHTSHSIFVKFPLVSDIKNIIDTELPIYFVIWTTTPWTLPANLAIALNPNFIYVFLKTKQQILVIGEKLLENFLNELEIKEYEILLKISGDKLENLVCKHPFYDRESVVILADFVTSEQGTGAVHIAPGHGLEDYEAGLKYGLKILSPVNEKGIFTEEAGDKLKDTYYKTANKIIIEELKNNELLLKQSNLVHSYPHCWRCHEPVIYRATSQWFAAISPIRQNCLDAITKVKWYPKSGEDRIGNMIKGRSDWCLSRQRTWGVPIPVFYCKNCNETILNEEVIEYVAKLFEQSGADIWWEKEANDLLPLDFKCSKCGGKEFIKEKDIIDVWFDSGVSHTAVIKDMLSLSLPVDLYLEGSDQHRGWFQSSLITSIVANDNAPYKEVITHGFTVDGNGRKMSKSLGNVIEPKTVIEQYGADVLRLWVASVDYHDDIKVSMDILKQLAEIYKKIRNTVRFLLANLYDFEENLKLPYSELPELEKYVLHRLQEVIKEIRANFDNYEFYKFYQILQNYCVVDLSSFYLDIIKDTLYIYPTGTKERVATQTVLWEILYNLAILIAPVLSHLAEDIWQHLPAKLKQNKPLSVFWTDFPNVKEEYINYELSNNWVNILKVRDYINKSLEIARTDKVIGSSLEAKVLMKINNSNLKEALNSLDITSLCKIFIVSEFEFVEQLENKTFENNDVQILITKTSGNKCERCWNYSITVGENINHSTLCKRCIDIIENL